jgi:hypothetical protein
MSIHPWKLSKANEATNKWTNGLPDQRSSDRQGMILIYTLVVIAALTLGTYGFMDLMQLEYRAIRAGTDEIRATQAAESGVVWVASQVATRSNLTASQALSAVPGWSDSAGNHYGAEILGGLPGSPWSAVSGPLNECAKLNLNAIDLSSETLIESRQRLLALPGMTPTIADSILDWIDADDDLRDFGAESSWYSAQGISALPKQGPFEQLHELLQVRGVNRKLLFGEDANGNGWLDANEDDGDASPPRDNQDHRLDAGWSQWLTVVSTESNLNAQGRPKIDVNQDSLPALFRQLEQAAGTDVARYIVALRMNGPVEDANVRQWNDPEEVKRRVATAKQRAVEQSRDSLAFNKFQPERISEFAIDQAGVFRIQSLALLLGQRVEASLEDQNSILRSPWTGEPQRICTELEWLESHLTIRSDNFQPGRIHVGFADQVTLLTIPGMIPDLARKIAARREKQGNGKSGMANLGTLVEENIVNLATLQRLAPYLTAGGDVYSGISLGKVSDSRNVAAITFLIDATTRQPIIRQMTRHPFSGVIHTWSKTR